MLVGVVLGSRKATWRLTMAEKWESYTLELKQKVLEEVDKNGIWQTLNFVQS